MPHLNLSIDPRNPSRTVERLLLGAPTFIAIVLGLVFMLGRFVTLLREDFKETPANVASIFLVAVMIGSVTVIIVLWCAVAGATIGLALRSWFGRRLTMALSRDSRRRW
jgi:hypothetical protein